MKKLLLSISILSSLFVTAQTIPTTTVTGSLRINDSLNVTNNISTTGDMSVKGEVTSQDTLRAQKDILVDGNAKVAGDLTISGNSSLQNVMINNKLLFPGNMAFKSFVNTRTGTTDFSLGAGSLTTEPTDPDIHPCFEAPLISTLNYLNGKMTFWGTSPTMGTRALTIGHDGVQGFIDAAGGSGVTGNRLLLNYYCGKDVYICTGTGLPAIGFPGPAGTAGGVVAMGPNVEIGNPTRSMQTALNMKVKNNFINAMLVSNNTREIFSIQPKGNVKITTLSPCPTCAGSLASPYALSVYDVSKSREVFNVGASGDLSIYTETSTFAPIVTPIVLKNVTLGKNVFEVQNDGRTFIGVKRVTTGTHNNAMLHVDGKIACKEVIVLITNWADFVFDKNYKLMPLKDVETYIKANKHLPNVPSANDVEINNGIDVAKTQTVLLQKIEELTLYLIEQNKRLEAIEKENAFMKAKLNNK